MSERTVGYGLPVGEPSQSPREPVTLRPQGERLEFAEHRCDAMPKIPEPVMIHVIATTCDLWLFNSGEHFCGFIKYCPWCGERLAEAKGEDKRHVGNLGEAAPSALASEQVSGRGV